MFLCRQCLWVEFERFERNLVLREILNQLRVISKCLDVVEAANFVPHDLVCTDRHDNVVHSLVEEYHADVNVMSSDGLTPLRAAVFLGTVVRGLRLFRFSFCFCVIGGGGAITVQTHIELKHMFSTLAGCCCCFVVVVVVSSPHVK